MVAPDLEEWATSDLSRETWPRLGPKKEAPPAAIWSPAARRRPWRNITLRGSCYHASLSFPEAERPGGLQPAVSRSIAPRRLRKGHWKRWANDGVRCLNSLYGGPTRVQDTLSKFLRWG